MDIPADQWIHAVIMSACIAGCFFLLFVATVLVYMTCFVIRDIRKLAQGKEVWED